MFGYKENGVLKFIFKEKKSLPFYEEEEVDIFEKDKLEIMKDLKKDGDFFCLFGLLLYKSNGVIAGYELGEEEYKKLSIYEGELKINNKGGFDFIGEKIDEFNNQEKIKEIELEFESKIKQFTAGYSQAEIDTWQTKVEEARKVINGETSDFLTALTIEGEEVEDLANHILEKAKLFSLAYARAEKVKREKLNKLESNLD